MVPKVSIIVPIFNVEKYLDTCIKSLINQTLEEIEIILVDDESPDSCPKICDMYASKDSRIKVIHKKNGGLGLACNSGLEIAGGDYVAFCDSDDWVDLDTYEVMYNAAINNHADIVLSSFKYVDINGALLPDNSLTYKDCIYSYGEINTIMKGMIASAPFCTNEREFQASAKVTLYKRKVIECNSLRFVSERIIPSEDLVFNLDYLSCCRTAVTISRKFYNYRYNPISISRAIKQDSFSVSKILLDYLDKKVDDLQLGDDGHNRVDRLFIALTRANTMKIIRSKNTNLIKNKLLNEICSDKTLKEIKKRYPTRLMPIKHRFFLWATTNNLPIVLKLLTR